MFLTGWGTLASCPRQEETRDKKVPVIVGGDTSADKARDFIGKGHPGGEQEGKGTQENCSGTLLSLVSS